MPTSINLFIATVSRQDSPVSEHVDRWWGSSPFAAKGMLGIEREVVSGIERRQLRVRLGLDLAGSVRRLVERCVVDRDRDRRRS
jgi:hypothetical protein